MYKKGFTKIEILIIAAIIGILGITAVVAISTARSRTRDAVRMSDIRQLQAGLELFFIDHNAYPEALEYTALGYTGTMCLSSSGFSSVCESNVYLESVGKAPSGGLNDMSSCSDISNAYCYLAQDGDYRIQFELEHDNPVIGLVKGLNCASHRGLYAGTCDTIPTIE
jgi:general secretion pathway protein G